MTDAIWDTEQHANHFTYSDAIDGDQIRLLEIRPGSIHNDLHCNLITVQRSSKHSYKALSYFWGDPTPTHRILVNEQAFWIHTSLFEALVHIRHLLTNVLLWTDKVCINQETIERNSQVQAMGKTYAEAEEVVIWLGTAPPGSRSLSLVCSAIQDQHRLSSDDWTAVWPAMRDVLHRSWFERLWTFQEAILAPKGKFLLGPETCDLEAILKLDIDAIHSVVITGVHELVTSDRLSLHAIEYINRISQVRKISTSKLRWHHASLVYICQGQKCRDPRDHVFGLVGAAQILGYEAPKVDYDSTIAEVFTAWMKLVLLQDSTRLTTLEAGNKDSGSPLPSWVPDLAAESEASPLPLFLYTAGGDELRLRLTDSNFTQDDKVLSLGGFVSDEIIDVAPLLDKATGEQASHHLQSTEQQFLAKTAQPGPYRTYQGRLQAFWRTTVANCRQNPLVRSNHLEHRILWPENDTGIGYEIFMGRASALNTSESSQSEDSVYSISSARVLLNRRLFVTSRGFFGLGPRYTQIGDLVVVIPGIDMPIILRERSQIVATKADVDDFSQRSSYTFIGSSYVHGIMNGEVVKAIPEGKDDEYLQIFEID